MITRHPSSSRCPSAPSASSSRFIASPAATSHRERSTYAFASATIAIDDPPVLRGVRRLDHEIRHHRASVRRHVQRHLHPRLPSTSSSCRRRTSSSCSRGPPKICASVDRDRSARTPSPRRRTRRSACPSPARSPSSASLPVATSSSHPSLRSLPSAAETNTPHASSIAVPVWFGMHDPGSTVAVPSAPPVPPCQRAPGR